MLHIIRNSLAALILLLEVGLGLGLKNELQAVDGHGPIEGATFRTQHRQKATAPKCGVGARRLSAAEIKRAKVFKQREIALYKRENRLRNSNVRSASIAETQVTVLVVYTPLVTKYLGSKESVEQHIGNAKQQANLAFRNSGIPLQIEIVHMEEVAFPESHVFDTDLNRLAFDTKGQRVRDIRNQYNADQVALIVDDGDMGGLAFGFHPRWDVAGQPSPLEPSQFDYWSQRAFFEVRDDCIDESYKCFAHELAHNFGAGHDYEDWLRLYWDSHGYSFNPNDNPDEGLLGTMMSYEGADHRILYFSNPAIMYLNKATGAPGHDNAKAIIDSMGIIARYR